MDMNKLLNGSIQTKQMRQVHKTAAMTRYSSIRTEPTESVSLRLTNYVWVDRFFNLGILNGINWEYTRARPSGVAGLSKNVMRRILLRTSVSVQPAGIKHSFLAVHKACGSLGGTAVALQNCCITSFSGQFNGNSEKKSTEH